jgi:hypothetical protein
MTNALHDFLSEQVATNVHPAVKALAEKLAETHSNVQLIFAYGSALRDSNPTDTLVDFYVLTQSLADVSPNAISRALCSKVPPNVYYLEHQHDSVAYRAKYAVMPAELLAQKVSAQASNPYFWARFCQPMQLIFARDDIARKRAIQILARAATTARSHARKLSPQSKPDVQWTMLFRETYQTELRPEDVSRADLIFANNTKHFETISNLTEIVETSEKPWETRRWQGKLLSLLRLAKAAFTFQGGADYAAWKIKRHSGVDIEIKDWHRKHPLLASIVLLPKLLRKGGLK